MSTGITPSTWDQNAFETMMKAEANGRWAGRAIFQPAASPNTYVKNVDEYSTDQHTKVLSMGAGFQPITIGASVSISMDAQDDAGLRAFAARQLGDAFCFAEDAVVLHGKKWKVPPQRGPVTLTIEKSSLKNQIGLFDAVGGPVPDGKTIAATVKALNALRGRGHHGPFVVVVGTGLNEEAWRPTAPGIVSAPIQAILPELRTPTDGWIWSDVVDPRAGVAMSLGGETFDYIITYDIHVESALVTNTFDIKAALQIRLRINDNTAIEPLS